MRKTTYGKIASRLSASFAVIALTCATAPASADASSGETSLEVAVGETASMSVGFARGLQCDDLTVIQAELRADSGSSNRLFIKGLRAGSTDCRVGTAGPPTLLVHITVKAPAR